MVEFIKEDDDIWEELKPLIPPNKQYSDDVHFINSILTLLKARENNRFEKSLNWKQVEPYKLSSSYNRRFNRWRNDGVWEKFLSVFVRYKEFNWLGNPYIYTILLRDYELFTKLNTAYVLTLTENELTENEILFKLKTNHPKVIRNRRRRIDSESKYETTRGAYKKVYSEEDQELIKDLEDGTKLDDFM